jgi:hypothetical protein
MSPKRSSWSRPPIPGGDDDATDRPDRDAGPALPRGALADAKDRAAELGGKVAANMKPVADAVGTRVRAGLGKVGDALRADEAAVPAELLSQADLPELVQGDALASLASRLDREADFWRSVAMRQLARAAWTERLGVSGSLLLLIGATVLAAIAAFRALFASDGGTATAMLLGVGLLVLLIAALAVGRLSSRLRQGQLEAVREALVRADLSEMRLHRVALLLELRATARDGFVAALTDLEADVRNA